MNANAISDMIGYYKNLKYAAHSLKVHGYAMGIAAGEGMEGDALNALLLAALFHDVGIPVALELDGSAAGPYQEKRGAPIAMELAQPYAPEDVVRRVGELVGQHHSFRADAELDLRILFEADWLVNLEESAAMLDKRDVFQKHFATETGKQYFEQLMK